MYGFIVQNLLQASIVCSLFPVFTVIKMHKNKSTFQSHHCNIVIHLISNNQYFFLEAPRITWVSIDQQIIALGDTVIFYCVVDGSPAPNITWQSNNGLPRSRVEFRYDNMLMAIKNVSDSDAGSYSCKTSNIIGEDKKVIDLRVVGKSDVHVSIEINQYIPIHV